MVYPNLINNRRKCWLISHSNHDKIAVMVHLVCAEKGDNTERQIHKYQPTWLLLGAYNRCCFMIFYRGQDKTRGLRDSSFKETKEFERLESESKGSKRKERKH